MSQGFVVVGDERMVFSFDAIEAVGLQSGARVTSMAVLEALISAEASALEARHAIWRAQASAWLGGAK